MSDEELDLVKRQLSAAMGGEPMVPLQSAEHRRLMAVLGVLVSMPPSHQREWLLARLGARAVFCLLERLQLSLAAERELRIALGKEQRSC